ncbi:MAG: acetaldehyde dehydrogenase (acetylating) [Chloroflexota bacterium]
MEKTKVVILGSGNIGTDLMYKVMRSESLEVGAVVGIDPASDGLSKAACVGHVTSAQGAEFVLKHPEVGRIVLDATSARAHLQHAELFRSTGHVLVDLTPAAVGPYVVPVVNLPDHFDLRNVNMVTCGGQATIPLVAAISRVTPVEYAEIVATIASKSAGPGTRQNIDEFTRTTARGLVEVGGAREGKAIIILNPAEPPIMMRCTIYARVSEPKENEISAAVEAMVRRIQEYVPGYRLWVAPLFEGNKVTTMIEVEGAGDYLPRYAGNLDIMTAAATRVAEEYARHLAMRGDGRHG